MEEFVKDPEAIASSLNIAVRHAEEVDYEGYMTTQIKTFDLAGLKDVEDYIEEAEDDVSIYVTPLDSMVAECRKMFMQFQERELLSEAESLIRIEKIEELNTSMLNIVKHFLYELRTFNLDKRWEVSGRSLFKMREGLLKSLDANGPEREEELILLDMFNDPQQLAMSADDHRAILAKNAKGKICGKRTTPVAGLLECIRDDLEDFGAAAGAWNGVMKRMTDLPPPLSWEKMVKHNPDLSPNLPKRIRRYFLELVFLRSELQSLQFEIVYMIYFLRELLRVWWRAGEEAWEFGKKHIYVMPHFREFEFTRHALLSTQYLILRLDYKIAKFSRSAKGQKYSFPSLYRDLQEDTCDVAWKEWIESVREELLSPEELMERLEREEKVREEYWEEQRVLAEELAKQMAENVRAAKAKSRESTKEIVEAVGEEEEDGRARKGKRVGRKGKGNA